MREENNCYPVNGIRVCIDKSENIIEGRAFSPLKEGCIAFCGVEELLLKIDRVFDENGYPQAFQEKRSFREGAGKQAGYRGIPHPVAEEKTIVGQQGEKATYDIVVDSRRNTSWQGSVYGADGCRIGDFSGELELLKYLA